MRRRIVVACVAISVSWALVCASAQADGSFVVRAAPHSHVELLPALRAGHAGWCFATGEETATEGISGCGIPIRPLTGPIFEAGCDEDSVRMYDYVFTTTEVRAVSVAGSPPIPTTTNPTLIDGLRAVALEIIRHKGQPSQCPPVTPLDGRGKVIHGHRKRDKPLRFADALPGTQRWTPPASPPVGECELTMREALDEVAAYEGGVTTEVRSYHGLLGHPLLSCAETIYLYREEHHLTSAVLLDAEHPGTTPPALPGERPIVGRSGFFEAPGCEGELVARRISGAWLVVEEEDGIGLRVPLELLERLQATISL